MQNASVTPPAAVSAFFLHVRENALAARRTRLLFVSLCAYLASQAFTLPIAPVGPSWAVWPMLSDLAVGFILIARLMAGRAKPSRDNAIAFRWFALVAGFCALSYFLTPWLSEEPGGSKASIFGQFALYRLAQFLVVAWGASAVVLTPFRRAVLARVSLATFFIVCAGIFVTSFAIVLPGQIAAYLPPNRTSGAWLYYIESVGEGLGTIGYNHGYVAAQAVLLLALVLHWKGRSGLRGIGPGLLIFLGCAACFLSGSRMGLITMLLFSLVGLWQIPARFRFSLVAVAFLAIPFIAVVVPWGQIAGDPGDSNDNLLARQKTIFGAFKHESLSGRDDIWTERYDHLNRNPAEWVFGGGLGSAADMGGDAHMQVLQTVCELGLIGVVIWSAWFLQVLRLLWAQERNNRALFWASVCLLASCASQETLYPVAAMGHFLGFYLFAVALALQPNHADRQFIP